MTRSQDVENGFCPELELLIQTIRWPVDQKAINGIALAIEQKIDWDRFQTFAKCHRVVPLAINALSLTELPMPAQARSNLASQARSAVQKALIDARETVRLQTIFSANDLLALEIKGASTGLLAYGRLGMKQSWDIDLLVAPDNIDAADALLQANGYRLVMPLLEAGQSLSPMRDLIKEAVYQTEQGEGYVELHWRLMDAGPLLARITAKSPKQMVAAGAEPIVTLADEELYTYLICHGGHHCWSRLKWMADVAAFLSNRDQSEIAIYHRAATGFGAGRPSRIALALIDRIFGSDISVGVAKPLSKLEKLQFDNAVRCIELGSTAEDMVPYSQLWFRVKLNEFFLVDGLHHTATVLWGNVTRLGLRIKRRIFG